MEFKVEFSDGNTYVLREYFNAGDEEESGIEVWDAADQKCLHTVSGASFLDESDPDAEDYNAKEIVFIERDFFENY
jgi:hypothetical protein